MEPDYIKVKESLEELISKINLDFINKDIVHNGDKYSPMPWQGADVKITNTKPKASDIDKETYGGFYPAPRFVVTEYHKELSWLFFQLKDIFYDQNLLDGSSKIEFFGRLANAANLYISKLIQTPGNFEDLLKASLHEAFCMIEEMFDGSFTYLDVAPGGIIYDDIIDEAEKNGYLSVEESKKFFEEIKDKTN